MSSDGNFKQHSAPSQYDQNRTVRQAYSKRPVKKAPSPKQDELKENRRKMFLKKVKDSRDDRRYEQRGEDVRKRQYELRPARN
jgi:hypothetical protein